MHRPCLWISAALVIFGLTACARSPLNKENGCDGAFAPASMRLFKDVVSRADGDRCPMFPSCSQYSRQAFARHGFFIGWMMTADRLLRCGRDERRHAPAVMANGARLIYDPLDGNDFWWYGGRRTEVGNQ